jgi:hypothetical protein
MTMGGFKYIDDFTDPDNIGLRCIYYYLRNAESKKITTVCLVKYKEWYSRGMAICSKLDQFDKFTGKLWARVRAVKGVKILKNSEKTPTEKQIKRGRCNIRFISLDIVKREDALQVASSLSYYDSNGELRMQHLPSYYKISTFEESGLTDFEKRLVSKIKE